LQQILDSVDRLLANNKEKLRTDFYKRDFDDPLHAPKQASFSDGAPQRIHGEGKKDQDFWGPPKPKPPIPIEHI
jgi:hypothetical protein